MSSFDVVKVKFLLKSEVVKSLNIFFNRLAELKKRLNKYKVYE